MASRGDGIPGRGNYFYCLETIEKVCSGNSSWCCVAGNGKANGKMWRV